MRIGIFVACAGRKDGGPETYELGLVRALVQTQPGHEYRIFCFSDDAAQAFDLRERNVTFTVLRPRQRALSTIVGLSMALRRERLDVLHATMYPPFFSPSPYVFTMHDVSPLSHPEFYPRQVRARLKFLMARGLRTARLIICPTEDSRQTTSRYFGINLDRMSVVHHGIDPRFRPVPRETARAAVAERYGVGSPYLLYVGKLQERKNIVRMLEALDRLRDDAREVTLVLCGRRFGDATFIDETIARLRLKDRVVEIGYVPDTDVPLLYSGAETVLYPTLLEGFGFPVVEAMACGTPVITSNVSCLPEIAGDAAMLVNPESVDEIAAAIHRLHTDEGTRRDLIARGAVRAKTFTWEKAAARTLEVYRRACNG